MPEVLWKAYIDFEITQQDWTRVRDLYQQLMTRTKHVKVWISRAQFEVQTTKEMENARRIYTEADAYLKQQQNKEEVRVRSQLSVRRAHAYMGYVGACSVFTPVFAPHVYVRVFATFMCMLCSCFCSCSIMFYVHVRVHVDVVLLMLIFVLVQRVILLESWRDFEKQHGTSEQLRAVTSKMPKKVKKKRRVQGEDGTRGATNMFICHVMSWMGCEMGKDGICMLQMAGSGIMDNTIRCQHPRRHVHANVLHVPFVARVVHMCIRRYRSWLGRIL